MPAPEALLAGRYRIGAPLGAGGMATVHRARDERLERDVAIKVLLPNHAGDPVLAERFEREARALAAAAHPGIVAVYDVDPGDPTAGVEPFFVMELCEGGSLAERMAGGRRVPPDELVPILISVADGLAGLHQRGTVHRDIKPSNILLAPARAKLADFGVARAEDAGDAASDLTAPGTAVGTMAYLAPDVLAGGPAGPAGDIYALGVAAFAGLTGAMPRPASSVADLVAAGRAPAPLVSAIAPDLGTAFDEPIAAALDPDPARRPDALDLASALTSALGRWSRARQSGAGRAAPPPIDLDGTTAAVPLAPVAPVVPRPQTGAPTPPARRNTVLLAAGAALALVAAIAFTSNLGLGGRDPDASAGRTLIASAVPSASAQASPPPSPSPPPTTPPTAVLTPSVAQRALAALDGVDAALANAIESGELKNRDANALERGARAIRSALEKGELNGAANEASALSNAVEKLDDDIDEDDADRLQNAITAVIDILRDR